MEGFDELRGRVEAITGLNRRAAQVVALSMQTKAKPDEVFSPGQIVKAAEELGYEFDRPDGVEVEREPFAAEVTMDPAVVLSEVYENSPRVLRTQIPKLGKAPAELQQLDPDLVEQLPENVRAMLVKIDMFEGKATFWLRDEANDVDLPIGPIDVTRYTSGQELHQAFETLMRRLPLVLSADFN